MHATLVHEMSTWYFVVWLVATLLAKASNAQTPTPNATSGPTTTSLPSIWNVIGFQVTTTDIIYAGAGLGGVIVAIVLLSYACAVGTNQVCGACCEGLAKCCDCRTHVYEKITDAVAEMTPTAAAAT